MTTQLVNIDAFDYGAGTFVVKLRNSSDLSITVATAATVVASANVAARYIATFTTLVAAGVYYVEFVVNGAIYPQWVTLTGVDGEATETRNERASVLDSAGQQLISDLTAMISGSPAAPVFTGPALANAPAGGGGGAGTGARTVTITVNDGASVLQNATVRMTEGVNTFTALTNVAGVAVFNLDDATYTVSISKSGYSYAGTTIVVNGTETATYSMTAIVITPGSGSLTTGYLTVFDETYTAEAGITVQFQMESIPASGTGYAYDAAIRSIVSDVNGLVEIPLTKGASYWIWRGTGLRPRDLDAITISAAAGTTTALPSIVGPRGSN